MQEYAQSEHADLKYINGYDDPEIIAGAGPFVNSCSKQIWVYSWKHNAVAIFRFFCPGTMGIEIMEQVKDADAILVPVGGCGLIAGNQSFFFVPGPT